MSIGPAKVEPFHPKISLHSIDSASVIVPLVLDYWPALTVADFGCKHGEWLHVFQRHGIERVLGIDKRNDTSLLLIQPDHFLCADLTIPVRVTDRFDLAVCTEVAEHLPPAAARPLVQSLTETAEVVLFSAALPGQGGHGHLNEQPREYWNDLFGEYRYRCLDCIRPHIWQDTRVAWWYRQNLFLFATEGAIQRSPALTAWAKEKRADDLELIHKHSLQTRRLMRLGVSYLRARIAAFNLGERMNRSRI